MNLTCLTKALPVLATLTIVTGCSSTSTPKPAGPNQIGAPATSTPDAAAKTAPLGTPITAGQLSITIAGPATTRADGAGLDVTFPVTMKNTGATGNVAGPGSFAATCNGDSGGFMATTTAARKTLTPGQTLTGTAVVSWLQWNSTTQCGTTTIDAVFPTAGTLSWTIPTDQVATINKAAAGVSSASATP